MQRKIHEVIYDIINLFINHFLIVKVLVFRKWHQPEIKVRIESVTTLCLSCALLGFTVNVTGSPPQTGSGSPNISLLLLLLVFFSLIKKTYAIQGSHYFPNGLWLTISIPSTRSHSPSLCPSPPSLVLVSVLSIVTVYSTWRSRQQTNQLKDNCPLLPRS